MKLCLFFVLPLFAVAQAQDVAPNSRNIHLRGDFSNFATVAAEGKAHVVTLGGSITQKSTGHSKLVPDWLKKKFPNCEFEITNAGLSSTCSMSGAYRLDKDVLQKGAVDLLIVEFAVNDDQDAFHSRETARRGMEGIIRHVRYHNPEADILMVHYVNPEMLDLIQRGETPDSIAAHESVAIHYDITSVSVAGEVADATQAGTYTWDDYGGTHPGEFGYQIAAKLMTHALEAGLSHSGESKPRSLPDPLDKWSYERGELTDPQELAWLGGWDFAPVGEEILPVGSIREDFAPVGEEILPVGSIREDYREYQVLRSDQPGSMLYFNFRGSAIGAFVLAGPDAGMAEYAIDGGEWRTIDFFHKHSGKLNYPRSVMFEDELSNSFHQIAIRVSEEKNALSKGNALSFLFFETNR